MRREGARDVASAGPRISIPRSHGRQGPSLRLASRSLTALSRGKYAQIRRQAQTKWYAAVQRRGLTGAAFSDIDHPLKVLWPTILLASEGSLAGLYLYKTCPAASASGEQARGSPVERFYGS